MTAGAPELRGWEHAAGLLRLHASSRDEGADADRPGRDADCERRANNSALRELSARDR